MLNEFNFDGYISEKSGVRKVSNHIGLALIISEIVSVLASLFISKLFISLHRTELLKDQAFLLTLNSLLSFIAVILPFAVCCRINKYKLRNVLALGGTSGRLFFGGVLACFGFNAISNIVSNVILNVFSFLPFGSTAYHYEYEETVPGFLLTVLNIAIIPAIFEEFAFRGVALGLLRKKMPDMAAVTVSALLFGLLHGNMEQIPFAFCMCMVFALSTVLTGSMWPAITAHFLNNFSSVVLDYISKDTGPVSGQMLSLFYLLISAIISIFGIMLLKEKIKEKSSEFACAPITNRRYIKWSVGSPAIIVFICIVSAVMLVTAVLGSV